MNKSKHHRTTSKATTSGSTPGEQVRDDVVNESELTRVRRDIQNLLTGLQPELLEAVHSHAEGKHPETAMMVDAWRQCGHRDVGRALRVQLSPVAKQTVTAAGIACLLAYAQAYLDELESRASRLRAPSR